MEPKNIFPIQFAFPNYKLPNSLAKKTDFFSDLTPIGRAKKYRFFVEDDYYRHYSKSQFAVTMKKGGWDCLRHYEILASGTLPYFLDIEKCPENTLFAWPKELLTAVKHLPGMPKEWQVKFALKREKLSSLKPKANFDLDQYGELHEKLMKYFLEHLTTQGLSQYVLKKLELPANPRVLLCFGVWASAIDYCRDILIAALGSNKNVNLTVYPQPFWHLQSCHRSILNTLYGRGFTCTANLSQDDFESPTNWPEIEQKLDSYDAIFACTSSNQGFDALPAEVQKSLAHRSDIIWVDGNDLKGNHEIPACTKAVFRREF